VSPDAAHAAGTLDLRLIVITDTALAAPRTIRDVVAAALEAGAPAIQLRDKSASAAALLDQARALVPLVRRHGARLFINDRVDIALLAQADGVHLGPDDLPVRAVRNVVPADFHIGFSTDDPAAAAQAVRDGATYIGCGAVFGTTTKAEAAGERIGTQRLHRVANAVTVPVVGIGGITTENVAEVAATGVAGVAVIGAVMSAPDPTLAVRTLLQRMQR
jgi:thiamine-phosphate pyrophosphorylase